MFCDRKTDAEFAMFFVAVVSRLSWLPWHAVVVIVRPTSKCMKTMNRLVID